MHGSSIFRIDFFNHAILKNKTPTLFFFSIFQVLLLLITKRLDNVSIYDNLIHVNSLCRYSKSKINAMNYPILRVKQCQMLFNNYNYMAAFRTESFWGRSRYYTPEVGQYLNMGPI